MNRLLVNVAMTVMAGSLLYSNPVASQESPSPKKATRVRITQGPELELAKDTWAIIRWTSNNPGGSDEHFGVVHYGRSPKELDQTAKSHIRLNRDHAYTVFRVRVESLKPRTTYYYSVDSMEANGTSDHVMAPVSHFTTR